MSKYVEDFFKFCGLLKISELYVTDMLKIKAPKNLCHFFLAFLEDLNCKSPSSNSAAVLCVSNISRRNEMKNDCLPP